MATNNSFFEFGNTPGSGGSGGGGNVNITQIDSVAVAAGAGAVTLGTLRVTLASNDPAVTYLSAINGKLDTIQISTTSLATAVSTASTGHSGSTPVLVVQPVDAFGNVITGGSSSVTADITDINGNTVDVGSGAAGTGTLRVALANDKYIAVSKNTNANVATNPLFVELTDGTTAIASGGGVAANAIRVAPPTDAYFRVSKDGNANSATNALFITPTDGTNALTVAAGDSVPSGSVGVVSIALAEFYNGTNYQRWTGATVGDALTATPAAPYAAAVNLFYDGTNHRRWLGTVLSSAPSSASYAPLVASVTYGYDGSAFQKQRMDDSGNTYVLQAATAAGEDVANDWRKVKLEEIATYSPTPTTGTTVNGTTEETANVVLAALEVLNLKNFTIWLKNNSATALTMVYVYGSPDNSNWVNLSSLKGTLEVACETLSNATGIAFIVENNSMRYIKVTATVASGSTTCNCWITGNK